LAARFGVRRPSTVDTSVPLVRAPADMMPPSFGAAGRLSLAICMGLAVSCGGRDAQPQKPPVSTPEPPDAAGGAEDASAAEPPVADAPLADARAPEPDAAPLKPDAPAADSAPDAAVCPAPCTPGERRCGPGGGLQICAVVGDCAGWGREGACGGTKVCRPAGASAFCACPDPPPSCPGTPGTLCDSRGEVVMCGLDESGCVTVQKRMACAAGRPCVGSFPAASCSCPSPPAECRGGAGSFCPNSGALATCALDDSGCIAIVKTEVCAAGRACKGTFPSAVCQCLAPNFGQPCGKCGGVLTCEGACSVPTPANHGADCGLCGGKIGCDGACSAPTPADFGAPCGSCGGTVRCDGTCSVPTPANFGALCGACGTIQCDGTCNRPAPPSQLQHVNAYQGDLGPSRGFVRMYKYPVGAVEQAGTDGAAKLCSGTLIGRDRFLTSGRCIDGNATSRFVVFNHERLAGSITLAPQRHYPILEVLEDERGGFDYAIVRLGGNPGDTFGWARISAVGDHGTGQSITVIQHPAGAPKQIEAGAIQAVAGAELRYTDVETTTGSEGAGVLDDSGELLAVHTGTECAAGVVRGKAVRLPALRTTSPIIAQLSLNPGPRTVQGDVHVATSDGSAFHDRGWRWADWHCVFGETCAAGDVTGDKRADLVAFLRGSGGDVYVADGTGTAFEGSVLRHDYMCAYDEECMLADVNGDGKQDLIADSRLVPWNPADVWVSLATADGFGAPSLWSGYHCTNGELCAFGDFDGDGKDDVLAFTLNAKRELYVGLAQADAFSGPMLWGEGICASGDRCTTADMNGDGKDDLVAFTAGEETWVALSDGARFSAPTLWGRRSCRATDTCRLADVDADGRADVIAFDLGTGGVSVARSDGRALGAPAVWLSSFCHASCDVGDVNGDGRADVISYTRY
jgi:V8-like Glu-specific endopeptidase